MLFGGLRIAVEPSLQLLVDLRERCRTSFQRLVLDHAKSRQQRVRLEPVGRSIRHGLARSLRLSHGSRIQFRGNLQRVHGHP